jgi:thiamine kinase-like enzyme
MENKSLVLLDIPPEARLMSWLEEFYGKPVQITARQVLRHRDLSFVERICIKDALPATLIYKVVLPPWDVEKDLHEKVLIPSISNSARLYLSAHHGQMTALFMEDLGEKSLLDKVDLDADIETVSNVGKELAKLHRAYSYRIDELATVKVLPSFLPIDYLEKTKLLADELEGWQLASKEDNKQLQTLATHIANELKTEPISLVHGDMYAENIIINNDKMFIIDWSWFTMIGVPTMDLATLLMESSKNGNFTKWKQKVIEAYCFEAGRDQNQVMDVLPAAECLARLLFLYWLVERRRRKIMGTTIGPVDNVIKSTICELRTRISSMVQH